jgi:PTS system nitrogen regulatory IIA component
VANWAAARGLAAQAGFLAPENVAVAAGLRVAPLLRNGGIWRNVEPGEVRGIFAQVVGRMAGATPPIRQLLTQRLRASDGVTFAPVGGGFALPHPSARVALGRDSGIVALVLLKDALALTEPCPDSVPVTRLIFFIAPSPRAHVDLLGRLSRLIVRGTWREAIDRSASDEEILLAIARAENNAASGGMTREVTQ